MSNDVYPITQKNLNAVPKQAGVYALYEEEELIYIGKAESGIRTRLQRHVSGEEGQCTQAATHYWREACSNPEVRETELLNSYLTKHGRLPRCNERIG